MLELTMLQKIAVAAIPLLLAITLHEVAHGWVANRLGDPTARMLGRLSLNPLRHIDLFGTIILPILLYVMSGFQFTFGWAKPVPITWQNLKKPRRDMPLVAMAGPAANALMLLGWAFLAKFLGPITDPHSLKLFFVLMAHSGILVNLALFVLNLVPIPPLDGSRVVAAVLPRRLSLMYSGLESYGFMILIALLATGVLNKIVYPPVIFLLDWIYQIFGL